MSQTATKRGAARRSMEDSTRVGELIVEERDEGGRGRERDLGGGEDDDDGERSF